MSNLFSPSDPDARAREPGATEPRASELGAGARALGRVIDHRLVPLGVMPRHLQQWGIIGIAVVMVGIMALSGPPTKPAGTTTPSPSAGAVDPNQQRIEEYQRRIQEQAQRLAAEQAQLQQAKNALAADSDDTLAPGPAPARPATASAPVEPEEAASGAGASVNSDARDESAHVADNVAFSRPSPPTAIALPVASATAIAAPGALPPLMGPTPSITSAAGLPIGAPTPVSVPFPARPAQEPPAPALPAPAPSSSPSVLRASAASLAATPASAAEPRYTIYEGTIIETVLTNRLDGTFSGPVNCLVSVPVYAADHLVIPAGARVLGEARAVNTFGQSRLAVTFHRVILPNGAHVSLDAFHGLNQVGDLGLRDQVDRHYAQIFGVSLALGAISGFAQGQTSVGLDATAIDAYRQGAAANVSQSSTRVLDRFLNLLPTVTIREGHRIKVYLSSDLELPAYHAELSLSGGHP